MKLSEAMRAGAAKLDHQIRVFILKRDENGKLCGCAMGAVAVGAGFDPELYEHMWPTKRYVFAQFAQDFVERTFPELAEKVADGFSLFGEIVRRNDTQEQSFEEIAAWLEGQGQ